MIEEEKIEELRLNLVAQHKCNVHSFIIETEDENNAVIFLKEPARLTKIRVLDLFYGAGGAASASDLLIQSCLIKEASDQRLATDDRIYLSLVVNCMDLIQYYSNVQKKS